MKNQITSNYGRVLYELSISEESINDSSMIFTGTPELLECLCNPVISKREKEKVIDRIFPEDIRNFLKVTCEHQEIGNIMDIFQAYHLYAESQKGVVRAELSYVTPPSDSQADGLKAFVKKTFGANEVKLQETKDASLIGGFILKVGSQEYDWSTKGKLDRLGRELTSR